MAEQTAPAPAPTEEQPSQQQQQQEDQQPPPGMRVITAPYIESMEEFVREKGGMVEAMKALQATYNELKFLASTMQTRRDSLRTKLPDLEATLAALQHLSATRESGARVHYELAPGLHCSATVARPLERVNLWLGANVLMEYGFDEAETMVAANLAGARASVDRFTQDLALVKERMTTVEVNIARLYNFDVVLRRRTAAASAETASAAPVAVSASS